MGYGNHENMLLQSWQTVLGDFLTVSMLCISQFARQALAQGQNANRADGTSFQVACVAT